MATILASVLLTSGFVLLIKGADWLVDGSTSLAHRFSISPIVIGLTVVSFGTSSPELIVNIVAALENKGDIGFGNIIGSNIMNILLILGVSAIIRPLHTHKNTIWREIPFSVLAVVALFILCNDMLFQASPNLLSRGDAIILLLFFIIFMLYSFGISKVSATDEPQVDALSSIKTTILIVIGLISLIIGGKLVVDNASTLARTFGMSEKVIGLTIVAIGTSLPELVTSAMAAYKNRIDIAVGNVIGSNIFNVFFVLAVTALIQPMSYNSLMNMDMYVLFGASLVLFFTMFTGTTRRLDRWEAVVMVMLYVGYTIYLIW